jgi:Flp pilus assembly protein TadG
MIKKLLSSFSSAPLVELLARLKADRKGGVLIIMGFAIIPLTFAVGFGVDYARAMSLQTQLNAAADSAALAAVAPAMILLSNAESTSAATKMFNAQAALLNGYQNLVMTPVVVDGASGSGGSLGYLRKATISYTVQSTNVFGGILGARTLTVNGSASASAQQPPNVDFYLAMDNSPSMLLPATSDGVAKIIEATKSTKLPSGCAFACHMQMPQADGDPIFIDDMQNRLILLSTGYYTSGSSTQNVYYRWDKSANLVYDSSGNLMTSTSTSVGAPVNSTTGTSPNKKNVVSTTTTVSVTTYTVTDNTNGPATVNKKVVATPTTTAVSTPTGGGASTTTTTPGTANTTTTAYDTGYWADGYWLTHNYGQIYGSPSTITLRKDEVVSAASQLIPFATSQAAQYQVTYRAQMFSFDWTRSGNTTPVRTLNTLTSVASYGSGFSAAPLFPVDDYWWLNSKPTSSTDINDQATEFTNMLISMKNTIPTAGSGAPGQTPQKILFIISDGMLDQGGRYFGPLRTSDLTECTAIKAKGIKIAILYTQYLPESLVGNSWSQTNVAPLLPAPPAPYSATNAGSSDQVLTALQLCASPGTNGSPLVQTVTANDDITTALQQLFSTALQTARLVQ